MLADAGQQARGAPAAEPLAPDANQNPVRDAIAVWLNWTIFLCLCLISILAPHETQWAFIVFLVALPVWVIRLGLVRTFEQQPFLLPSLLFLTLAPVATAPSYPPPLTPPRLRSFTSIS